MKKFLLVAAASLGMLSVAAAADLPVRQPPPPPGPVGKAPIGKGPCCGKAPYVAARG
jgi:opacity protein-like surface antigen